MDVYKPKIKNDIIARIEVLRGTFVVLKCQFYIVLIFQIIQNEKLIFPKITKLNAWKKTTF